MSGGCHGEIGLPNANSNRWKIICCNASRDCRFGSISASSDGFQCRCSLHEEGCRDVCGGDGRYTIPMTDKRFFFLIIIKEDFSFSFERSVAAVVCAIYGRRNMFINNVSKKCKRVRTLNKSTRLPPPPSSHPLLHPSSRLRPCRPLRLPAPSYAANRC